MSYIETLITDINKTHPSLGELVAVLQIAVKARKFVLVVSPSGCGKSTAMSYIARNTSNSYMPTSLSIASLANKVEKLSGFHSVIVIDDIATIQTTYARTTTITTLSALCYSHRVEPSMAKFDFCIENFFGSALMGIQPILLKDLMLASEWDASMQDKTLRYYHLKRPLKPNMDMPTFKLQTGLSIDEIADFEPNNTNQKWLQLLELGMSQWSKARAKEHLIDFLKGVASLEGRKEVIDDDYLLLLRLLKPMTIENISAIKEQLEGERYLDNNLIALLVEYYTYKGEFSLAQVAIDYKQSLSQCYKIMQSQNGYWQQISKSPTIYKPSKKLLSILKIAGLEISK